MPCEEKPQSPSGAQGLADRIQRRTVERTALLGAAQARTDVADTVHRNRVTLAQEGQSLGRLAHAMSRRLRVGRGLEHE